MRTRNDEKKQSINGHGTEVTMKRRTKNILKALVALLMVVTIVFAVPESAFTSQAAGGYLTQNGLKLSLKKGKAATFLTYSPGVGYIKEKATLKSLKTELNNYVSKDGDVVQGLHIKAKIVLDSPKLTEDEEKQRYSASVQGNNNTLSYIDMILIDADTGYVVSKADMYQYNTPKYKVKKRYSYEYTYARGSYPRKTVITFECVVNPDKNWALGIFGCTMKGYNQKGTNAFFSGEVPFAKSDWYNDRGKTLSAWMMLN